ncbi:MAG: hypothetical protein K0S65_2801 [Labilithrix sp.]|nr:hypothetical protein [Labilithrix sp.]
MNDRPTDSSLHGSDRDFLEQAVRAMKSDLPDPARMRRLQEQLAPVLGQKTSVTRGGRRSWLVLVGALVVMAGTVAGARYRSAPIVHTQATLFPPETSAVSVSVSEQPAIPTVSVESLPSSADVNRESLAKVTSPNVPLPSATMRPVPADVAAPGDELALLEDARNALAVDPNRTLALARVHVKRFPKPAFAQERERLAIDALVRLGRRADAEARAASFEATYPDSAHLARVRALVTPRAAEERAQ